MWYRYVSGSAKSEWVQDGQPLGFQPDSGGHDYSFTKTGSNTLTIDNTGGSLTGMTVLIYRGGAYYSCTPTINGTNATYTAPITLTTGDKIIIRSQEGNYSYDSAALP